MSDDMEASDFTWLGFEPDVDGQAMYRVHFFGEETSRLITVEEFVTNILAGSKVRLCGSGLAWDSRHSR